MKTRGWSDRICGGRNSGRRAAVSAGLLAGWCWVMGYWVLPWLMPVPGALERPPAAGLDFRARHGEPLRKTLAGGARVEAARTLDAIPRDLVEATVCAEDKRFWSHGGIDFIALGRAARDAVSAGRATSGASTITQQLVKMTSPVRARTPKAKLMEMLTARKLEMCWSKKRILAEYLNRLDYGNLHVGCAAAAWGYFAKSPEDLTAAECAFVAGIPQAPTRLNPHRHPQRATARQRWILAKMFKEGRIDGATAARAILEPLQLKSAYGVFEAPHAIDLLLKGEFAGEQNGSCGAGTHVVRTTIDVKLQREVEAILAAGLGEVSGKNACHGAVVVIENVTGDVLALAGSGDYFSAEGGQINGAWAPRSPGSALKPFTYLLAMEKGDSPATLVDDLPVAYAGTEGAYRPVNYDKRYYGPMTYRAALANSLNVSAVKVLARIGGPEPLHRALERCGLTSLTHPPDHYGLGLTLGNAEVRLLELTNAYACLARLGIHHPWKLVHESRIGSAADAGAHEDSGRWIATPSRKGKGPPPAEGGRLFDADACYLLADVLADRLARSRAFGARSVLNLPFAVACKTGTSTDFRDNWTMGYTPEFTVGVWVGNFDNAPMRGVSGVTGAGPIFHRVFTALHRRHGSSWYAKPRSIVEAEIDIRNGKRWNDGVAAARGASAASLAKRREWVPAAHVPPEARPEDYDDRGRALLPRCYAEWLAGDDNWLGEHAAARDEPSESEKAPVIVFPAPDSTIYLDADLPDGGRLLRLQVEGGVPVRWRSETIRIERVDDGSGAVAHLVPGRHRIVARAAGGDRIAEAWVTVEEL